MLAKVNYAADIATVAEKRVESRSKLRAVILNRADQAEKYGNRPGPQVDRPEPRLLERGSELPDLTSQLPVRPLASELRSRAAHLPCLLAREFRPAC